MIVTRTRIRTTTLGKTIVPSIIQVMEPSYLEKLRDRQSVIAALRNVRLFPASFDPVAEFLCYPRPIAWEWVTLTEALAGVDAEGVMMRAPLWWQIEPILFAVCKKIHASIFVNEEINMPIGMAALKNARIDTVVTSLKDTSAFAAYLHEHDAPFPKIWISICSMGEMNSTENSYIDLHGTKHYHEIHAIPGVPIFTQCLHTNKRGQFHLISDVRYENGLVLGPSTDPIPFSVRLLDHSIETCNCGLTGFKFSK